MKIPQRSDVAKYASQVFYRDFNDVDIFIEDTAVEAKKIYVNLLRRVLGDGVALSQVFPIGSKSKVVQRCSLDQASRVRPAIYIVDGDHDDLLGVNLPNLKRFYRLKRYCIENYLFDESALVSYLDDEIVDRSRDEIEASLDFRAWFHSISSSLCKHVKSTIVAHRKKCADGLPRSNVPLSSLCSTEDGMVDDALIDGIFCACKERVAERHGAASFESEYEYVDSFFLGEVNIAILKFVSGKSVLLPLARRRIKFIFGVSREEVLFRLRLSKYCDIHELSDIRDFIL